MKLAQKIASKASRNLGASSKKSVKKGKGVIGAPPIPRELQQYK